MEERYSGRGVGLREVLDTMSTKIIRDVKRKDRNALKKLKRRSVCIREKEEVYKREENVGIGVYI